MFAVETPFGRAYDLGEPPEYRRALHTPAMPFTLRRRLDHQRGAPRVGSHPLGVRLAYPACEAREREWLVPDVPSSKVPGAAESGGRDALAPPAAGADATGTAGAD